MTNNRETRAVHQRLSGPVADSSQSQTREKANVGLGVIRCNDAEHVLHLEHSEQHRINNLCVINEG